MKRHKQAKGKTYQSLWPTLEVQLGAARATPASALERLIRDNQELEMQRPEETGDKVRLPPWIKIAWRKRHPEGRYAGSSGGYFVNNVERMKYRTFRRQGFFIGSGVIEAGCKTVIGCRCKQAGMFWGKEGAENILALLCIHSSRRLGKEREFEKSAHEKQNRGLLERGKRQRHGTL